MVLHARFAGTPEFSSVQCSSDRGKRSNISIFNIGSNIAFGDKQELIIIESKPLEQPENVKCLIAFLGDFINMFIPLKAILKPYSKNLSFR